MRKSLISSEVSQDIGVTIEPALSLSLDGCGVTSDPLGTVCPVFRGVNNKGPTSRIWGAQQLQDLVDHAPDRELLLTAKLTFHCFLRARALESLDFLDLCFDAFNLPVAVLRFNPDGPGSRLIPIDGSHRATLGALLPPCGPLFVNADPFGRLQRYAAALGMALTRRTPLFSCVNHGRRAGMSEGEMGSRLGLVALRSQIAEGIFYWALSADGYFGVDFTPGVDLPQYCGPRAMPRAIKVKGWQR